MYTHMGFPASSVVKYLTANAGNASLISGLGRSSGEGNDQPTSASFPGKSHGQRSLACYHPWCHRRVGHKFMTKQQSCTHTHTHTHTYILVACSKSLEAMIPQ